MKTCYHCRLDIPTSAQVCPGCLSDDPGNGAAGLLKWFVIAGLILFFVFG